jgi:hypothetical protein
MSIFKLELSLIPQKNRKRGMQFKKKSSPLKLLSQSQRSFDEMIIGWSPYKIEFGTIPPKFGWN